MTKRVLCFGDSNTWGYNPHTQERYDEQTRWTRVLARSLGPEYEIIEEGLNGRTTVWDDPIEGFKNGYSYLIPCLESHCPLDLVVILLGTNDLKMRFSVSASDIAASAGVLVSVVQQSLAGRDGKTPPVLLMAPPPLAKLSDHAEMFEGGEAKSIKLGARYQAVAQELGCAFLDTAEVIASSPLDGIHWEASEHAKLGQALAVIIKKILD